MEVTCKTVNTDLRPVILGFQNSIPCKEEFENASYGMFQSIEDKSTVAIVIEGERLKMIGTGSMIPEDQKLFLGVFSEEKKEIKLVPTSDIISVSQTVKGFEPTVVAKDDNLDYLRRRKMLVDQFGNKKSKQILKQRESARIETSTVIGGKSMEAILKIKSEHVPDLSTIVMKKPKKSAKRDSTKEKAKEPKSKKGKKE
ncbi:hypothetical protein JH06_5205 [Blastocystis sp. subtype 4]|uniref:hypothetical protein n=1 Tax=Blastocystis sp. subtype 4 TaxID=944170 RepID=UPI0007116A6E|nr:hypothetical protein JH06_5205 [Blastocystis sp. subtype 4]KNB41422.1 hypothetical protein JH06_5205 [Blastocystis sp. subtype 4]|eukprot:XP_014524865.1 hypothetical protein JH06_5205 [Blastocystis sp. subtype 4]